jgi:HK97 family phage prohead protease
MKRDYDFSGWASRNDLKCSDGRTIRRDAFKDNDGMIVPLVWNHDHNDPDNVLGHALLENREQGMYTYGYLNNTDKANTARELLKHGDIVSLSIYANKLKQNGGDVLHGDIKEVSVVLAGANPGAFIDSVIVHSFDGYNDEYDDGAVIYTDESIALNHADEEEVEEEDKKEEAQESEEETEEKEAEESEETEAEGEETIEHSDSEEKDMAENEGKTIQEVFDTLNDEQKDAVYAIVGMALEDAEGTEEGDEVKHNVFENDEMNNEEVLSHAEMQEIFSDAKRYGSLKESVLQHGIENIEILFPDAKLVGGMQEVKRPDEWVAGVMSATSHSPFSRVKSMYANLTEDEARARGYIKGKLKKEEVFSLLKRETTPTTVYKKQSLDRDDLIDITDFDIVSYMRKEMRGMLDEELARAFLIGDGRLASSDDKINEQNIRPIWKDDDLYAVKVNVEFAQDDTDDKKAKKVIRAAIKNRKLYKGSGNPVLYTTEDWVTEMLLMEDGIGHPLYDTVDKLATAMRVSKIVTVPVMENQKRTTKSGDAKELIGIIVNLKDYNVGADKGGAVSMFDDFDIDYNKQKYLIETRCSGALIKPFSALILETPTTNDESES